MIRGRFLRRTTAVLATCVLWTTACVTPLTHPLRATDGIIAQVALSGSVTEGDTRSCYPDYLHCTRVGSAVVAPWVHFTVGYAHVFARHFGLMGGVTAPTVASVQSNIAASKFGGFVFATFQNEIGSVGIGPEVNFSGWALAMGGELRLPGLGTLMPAIGTYVRWFIPFDGYNDGSWDIAPHRTLEIGVRLRAGPIFLQYSFFSGLGLDLSQPIYIEGAYTTSALHIFAIGLSIDGEYFERRRARRRRRPRVVIGPLLEE